MVYHFLMALPSTVCFLWAVLIFCQCIIGKSDHHYSYKILGVLLLFRGISFLTFSNHIVGIEDLHTYYILDIVDTFATPMIFPLIFIYIKSQTTGLHWRWYDYMCFAPGIFLGTNNLLIYVLVGEQASQNMIAKDLTYAFHILIPDNVDAVYLLHYFISVSMYNIVMLTQVICVAIYASVSITRYHRRLQDYYPDLDDKSIMKDKYMLGWLILAIIFSLLFHMVGRDYWTNHKVVSTCLFISWAVIYFSWAYLGVSKHYFIDNLEQDIKESEAFGKFHTEHTNYDDYNYTENEIDTETDPDEEANAEEQELFEKLIILFEKLMNDKLLYLRTDLRLDTIAQMLFTNRSYASRMIRYKYARNFSEHINTLRIKHAMDLMTNYPEIKQDELAAQSGFIGSQTFNRIFKHHVGLTPKEWLKEKNRLDQ